LIQSHGGVDFLKALQQGRVETNLGGLELFNFRREVDGFLDSVPEVLHQGMEVVDTGFVVGVTGNRASNSWPGIIFSKNPVAPPT
jgi:hypothetical protein